MAVWDSYVADNYYHFLGCCEATYLFHFLRKPKFAIFNLLIFI